MTTLTVTDELGNTATTTVELTVSDSTPPTADAGPPRRTVDEDQSVTFDAGNSTDNSEIATYEWDFTGDGTVDATGESIQHAFETPGTYEVALTAIDEGGNEDTDIQTVEVRDVTAPTADAGEDVVVGQGEPVTGDASESSDNVGIVRYGWDLDGDGAVDATGRSIVHSFEQPGTREVTLTVTDGAGNTDTVTTTVDVADATAPIPEIQGEFTVEEEETITFDGTASADNVGIERYEWNLDGDGTVDATGPEPTHTYTEDGTYEVSLTAVDAAGNRQTTTATVTVEDTSVLTANAGPDRTVGSGAELEFDGTNSESTEGITSYEWSFGDGTADTSPITRYTYVERGTYEVTLTVTDADGNTATDTATVEVTDVTDPEAGVSDDQSATPGSLVRLVAADSHDNREISEYRWNLGNGVVLTTTEPVIEYRYSQPGTYPVTVTVTDTAGNTDVATSSLTVADSDGTTNETDGVNTVSVGGDTSSQQETRPDNRGEGMSIQVDQTDATGDVAGPVILQDRQQITVENAPANTGLSVGLNEGVTDEESNATVNRLGNIIMDRLGVQATQGGDYTLTVETREINLTAVTTPGSTTTDSEQNRSVEGSDGQLDVAGQRDTSIDMSIDALSTEGREFALATGARPAGFIQVNHTISNDDVDGASFDFRVRKSYLNRTGVGPDAVQLFRDEDTRWNGLETRRVGETEQFYHYVADSPGLSLFTIGAFTPIFELQDATLLNDSIRAGKQIAVDATVANVGEANGTYVARLVANGEVVDTRTVDVEAGNQQVVRLTHTFEETGEYSLSIGNLSIGEGSVETGHAFELRETTLGADTVHTGEELTVEATVANNGTDEGTYEAQLVAGEEVVETQSVDIPDGEQRVVTFTHTFEAAGEYTLSIEEERVGEVVVQAPATTTIQTGTTETDDTERTIAPLWILLLAAIILLFVLWRRRDDEEEQESEDQRDKQAGNS